MRPSSALRRRAWLQLGIHAEAAARLAREHKQLQPSGAQVLDLDERARLMRGIAAFYGRLHAAAPDQLLWAGFAAIAVNDGVRPVIELTRAAAAVARQAIRLLGALARRLQPVARVAEDGLKCAFQTNYAIFDDLGWAHLAFLEGGIDAIRRLARSGELHSGIAAGFEDIARGARLRGESGRALIIRGNLRLFRHEQHLSVTPIFERYREAMSFLSRSGLIAVPNRTLAERAAALGRGTAWHSDESYGSFGPRWRWLVRHAWEPLVALDEDRRRRGCRRLETEVARAVAGQPEGTGPLWRRLAQAAA